MPIKARRRQPPPHAVTYAPSGPAGPRRFTDLKAALDAARDAAPCTLSLDAPNGGAVALAGVTYDWTGVSLVGLGLLVPVLQIHSGAKFVVAELIMKSCVLSSLSDASIVDVTGSVYIELGPGAAIDAHGPAPFFHVSSTGQLGFDLYRYAYLYPATEPIIDADAGAVVGIALGEAGQLYGGALDGDGSYLVTDLTAGLGAGAAFIDPDQPAGDVSIM